MTAGRRPSPGGRAAAAWARARRSGWVAFALALAIVVSVAALVYWFVFFSGYGQPPGFVYSQF